MPRASFLIFSFGSYLRSSRLSGHIIAFDPSFLRETDRGSFREHRDQTLRGLFFDDPPQRCRGALHHPPIRQCYGVYDVGLHVDPSIRNHRVGSRHLQHGRRDSLPERLRKELRSRPFLVWLDLPVHFSFKGDLGLISESEVVDVFEEHGWPDLLDDIDHSDVAGPIQSMRIGMVPDAFLRDIADLEIIDFDEPLIHVHV